MPADILAERRGREDLCPRWSGAWLMENVGTIRRRAHLMEDTWQPCVSPRLAQGWDYTKNSRGLTAPSLAPQPAWGDGTGELRSFLLALGQHQGQTLSFIQSTTDTSLLSQETVGSTMALESRDPCALDGEHQQGRGTSSGCSADSTLTLGWRAQPPSKIRPQPAHFSARKGSTPPQSQK